MDKSICLNNLCDSLDEKAQKNVYMNRKIPLFKVAMSDSVMSTLADTINSGYITQGPKVEEFERQLMSFLGVRHLLTVNSATNGLCLAYRLLTHSNDELHWPGLEDDDLVLSTPLTCFATNAPILTCRTRLNIQWVDVDLNTGNISLDDLESKISPRTKVITFVHWGGNPVDLQRLDLILDQAQVRIGFRPMVIEDCAHAFGAEIHGCKIGNSKNICVFSFQAIKHLTTADGGAITLPTQDMYDRCKLLRWYGIDRDQRNYQYRDFRL